jgi:hypothetical protein
MRRHVVEVRKNVMPIMACYEIDERCRQLLSLQCKIGQYLQYILYQNPLHILTNEVAGVTVRVLVAIIPSVDVYGRPSILLSQRFRSHSNHIFHRRLAPMAASKTSFQGLGQDGMNPPGWYRFRHSGFQYEELSCPRKILVHREMLVNSGFRPLSAAELGLHFFECILSIPTME